MPDAKFKSMINRLTATQGDHYAKGWDSVVNGVNTTNCHFGLFNSPENTKLWEAGAAAGKRFLAARSGDNGRAE